MAAGEKSSRRSTKILYICSEWGTRSFLSVKRLRIPTKTISIFWNWTNLASLRLKRVPIIQICRTVPVESPVQLQVPRTQRISLDPTTRRQHIWTWKPVKGLRVHGSEMIYVSVHTSVLVTKIAVWLSIVPLELHGKHHSSFREAFMPCPHTPTHCLLSTHRNCSTHRHTSTSTSTPQKLELMLARPHLILASQPLIYQWIEAFDLVAPSTIHAYKYYGDTRKDTQKGDKKTTGRDIDMNHTGLKNTG